MSAALRASQLCILNVPSFNEILKISITEIRLWFKKKVCYLKKTLWYNKNLPTICNIFLIFGHTMKINHSEYINSRKYT